MRPYFPHQHVLSHLPPDEAIQRDREYMAQRLVGVRLTDAGRAAYKGYTAPRLSRVVAWLELRQIVVGIVIGVAGAVAAAVVLARAIVS